MKKLLSEIVLIDSCVCDIEAELSKTYGSIIRWSIIEVVEGKNKVSFTYETSR